MARNESFFKRLSHYGPSEDFVQVNRKLHYKKSGIYCIYNKLTRRMYAGSAVNLYSRKTVHLSQLNRNKHGNVFLQRDYNKYGREQYLFFAVEMVEKKENLLKVEQHYIDEIFKNPNCYNLNPNASSWAGRHHTEKTKMILSQKAKGRNLSKETIEKMRKSHLGVPLPKDHPIRKGVREEVKEKIRNSMLGEKNHFYGKKHSEETKEKIRKKIKQFAGKYSKKYKVKAINLSSGEEIIFNSMADASRKLNLQQSHISSTCAGRLRHTGGWNFKKIDEENK